MLVSGVLMSCDTLVISSVLSRSLLSLCSTAMLMPRLMALRFSPWRLRSKYICEVSTCEVRSPAARASPPFCSRRSCMEKRQAATERTSSVSSSGPAAWLLSKAMSSTLTAQQPTAVRHTSGMPRTKPASAPHARQSTRQHHLKIRRQSRRSQQQTVFSHHLPSFTRVQSVVQNARKSA